MSKVTDATIIGGLVGGAIAVAPKLFDRLTGRDHDHADTAAIVAGGAGSVTAAALAVMEVVRSERDTCRTELAAAMERIDAIEARLPPGE